MALHSGTGKGPGHVNRTPVGLGGGGGGAGTPVQRVVLTAMGPMTTNAVRTQQAGLGGSLFNEKTA
jgi:hypothetical protein